MLKSGLRVRDLKRQRIEFLREAVMESIMEKSVTTNIKNYMKQLKVANANLELERERFRTLINEYSRNSHSLDIEMVTQNAKALERVQKELR